jgi:hypothetical protein
VTPEKLEHCTSLVSIKATGKYKQREAKKATFADKKWQKLDIRNIPLHDKYGREYLKLNLDSHHSSGSW